MVMMDSVSVVRAFRMLHDPDYVGGMNTENYLELCKAAGYSEESSQKAASEWAVKRLRKGLDV
jgi:hypothetical protein